VSPPRRIVVVGASLAGVRVVKALRRKGFHGQLVLIGEEDELPYDRPPLSKRFLSAQGPVEPKLLEPEAFYDGVDLRLGTRAVELRPRDAAVALDDGSAVRADHVVVATGAAARTLPALRNDDRASSLRDLADARRIRAAFDSASHVLIVGGGFIGCEVAASARTRGIQVTIVEAAAAPVVRGVGLVVGNAIAALHRDNGVDLRLATGIASVEAVGDRRVVTLTDGSLVETDFIVVGIGAHAQTDWLEGSGLTLSNGVLCDDRCRAAGGAGHVWAAGDVAAWPSRLFGDMRRVEHWTNAAEQASAVASNILGTSAAPAYDPIPYVWSDQYQHKIQILGSVSGEDDTTILKGSLAARQFAVAYSRAGRVRGLVACDLPGQIASARPLIAEAADVLKAAG
jgi:NADPH-dependent 2,4-dienoyl-CoA reductase/sulfur reductase-like enzyme